LEWDAKRDGGVSQGFLEYLGMVESLKVFKKCGNMALRDMV